LLPAVSEHQVGAELVPVHPGSLSEQYNVCGTPDCHCKDPKHPRKHGPYYQLSYTWRGKGSSRFVRPELVAEMRREVGELQTLSATHQRVGGSGRRAWAGRAGCEEAARWRLIVTICLKIQPPCGR